jgi:hypothetical protein
MHRVADGLGTVVRRSSVLMNTLHLQLSSRVIEPTGGV